VGGPLSTEDTPLHTTGDSAQLDKVLQLLNQSTVAAIGITEGKKAGQVGTIAAGTISQTAKDIGEGGKEGPPLWVYAAGGLFALWLVRDLKK